jgi:hypothetical protein
MSLAGLLVSLLILAGMAAGALTALDLGSSGTTPGVTLPSSGAGSKSGSGVQSAAGGAIGAAAVLAAQQNLDAALTVVQQQAVLSGYGELDPTALEGSARGLRFTNGPTTDDADVSMAVAPSAGGSVTLAARSATGECFYVWVSSSATWFGAGPGPSYCQALALNAAPSVSTAASAINWHAGSFP